MDPLASTRISICWPPEPHGEPEDVLVISGREGLYLDLRIDKVACSTSPTPRKASSGADPRIGWATAGHKAFLPLEPGEEHPRARFTALLDSRLSPSASSSSPTAAAAVLPDEGSFAPLHNGDVLETGSMMRPETGLVAPYEEVWRRLPVAPDARVVFLELIPAPGAPHEQAYVGRVGEYELGVARDVGGTFGAVRRERREDGRWETVFEAGEGARLPSLADFDVPRDSGSEVELAGRTWRVVEAS
ncbi:hypothetical protein JCM9279_003565 [Rhodotorula babjevae]